MLGKIQLESFKSYDYSAINLAPITLLCGGNSSGKTSIIKSILLLKQSFEATGSNYLLINGEYTSNGLYTNLRNKSNVGTASTDMGLSVSFVIDKSNPSFMEICRSIGMVRRQDDFKSFEIHAEFIFEENLSIPQVAEIKSSTIILVSNYSDDSLVRGDSISSKIYMERCSFDQHYNIALSSFPTPLYLKDKSFGYLDHFWEDCTCYFRGMQLVSLYKERLSKKSTSALPVLYTIFRALASEFGRINYIGPLRETPLRQYLLQKVYSEIGVKGENTAQYLGQFGDNEVYTHLPNTYEPQKILLKEAVKEWANFLGIDDVSAITSGIPGAQITQIMIGDQNIVDVGFGISQVLPILVQGLSMSNGNTLILEQPEIHLHPKMQMDIADFLIAMAKQGKRLIVETHSDHVINRIVRRAVEDLSLKDLISIYFIEKDENGFSKLEQVEIDDDLGIDIAPKGFFDQYASETEHILKAGYSNMRIRRGQK